MGTLVVVIILGFSTAALVEYARRRLIVVTVEGLSMQPEYQPGDRVLVRRGVLPRRGEVAVVEQPNLERAEWAVHLAILGHSPTAGPRWMIKRVTGTPGDPWRSHAEAEERPIPEGHLYVLGDNPEYSLDSRSIGLVPVGQVLGTVWRRL